MRKALLLFFSLFLFIDVDAYENDIFSIDIPSNYEQTINETNTYKWETTNSYISITIADNSSLEYNISQYSNEDINNQKEYIQNNINDSIKDYNIVVDVNNIEKIKIKNSYALKYNVFWPTKDITGFDINQIGNVFTTKKYIITLTYSYNDSFNEEEYNSIFNSFIINDESNSNSIINIIIFIACLLFCIFTIVKVILDRKKAIN